MHEFIRGFICAAFGLFAGVSSGIGTPTVLGMIGLQNKFEGIGVIVGIMVFVFAGNGLKELLNSTDKKTEKKR